MSKLALQFLASRDLAGLKPTAERILRAIAFFHADEAETAEIGFKKLMGRCKIKSFSTLAIHLRALEEAGLIKRYRRSAKNRSGRIKDAIQLVDFSTWRKAQTSIGRIYTYDSNVVGSSGDKSKLALTSKIEASIYRALKRRSKPAPKDACHDEDWLSLERTLLDRAGGLQ